MGTCRLLALLAASLGAACTVVPEVPVAAVKPVSARAGEAAQFAASARTASSSGNFTAAAKGYEDYLAALAKDKDRDPADYANGLTQLAGCYYRLRHLPKAIHCYREALACETLRLGPDHEDVTGLWSILASVELRQGNALEAERIQRKLLVTEYRLHTRGRRGGRHDPDQLGRGPRSPRPGGRGHPVPPRGQGHPPQALRRVLSGDFASAP